jgi:quercetin dioxygenase-like cupin family protein
MQQQVSLLRESYEDADVRASWFDGDRSTDRLPAEGTTYIAVAHGSVVVRGFILYPAMFAAAPGMSYITGTKEARALLVHAKHYRGMMAAGGPLEDTGRLRYIDGCTDTGLIGPIKQGDPCLNHLHFPPGIIQTEHTHPSVRIGLVTRGRGLCRAPTGNFPLEQGSVFVIPTGALHGFSTEGDTMDIIAFHPDSIVGPTDERHQMLEATLGVDGGDTSFGSRLSARGAAA